MIRTSISDLTLVFDGLCDLIIISPYSCYVKNTPSKDEGRRMRV